MKRVLLISLLLCLPAAARAETIEYPFDALVQMSDIIVVGTLRDVSERTEGGMDYGQGRIEVREVIWGRVSPGDALLLRWSNQSDIGCPRVEHKENAGREGVWLLTEDGAAVRADHLGDFVEPASREKVERALAASPVVLRRRGGYLFRRGEPVPLTVVYRNATDSPRRFTGVVVEGGRLRLGWGSALVVERMTPDGPQRAGLSERVTSERVTPLYTVEARGEQRVEFDLSGLLAEEPKEGDSFVVSLRLASLPETNRLRFYVGGTAAGRPETASPPVRGDLRAPAAGPPDGALAPVRSAGLTALGALLLFPVFYKLRSWRSSARLARAPQGR